MRMRRKTVHFTGLAVVLTTGLITSLLAQAAQARAQQDLEVDLEVNLETRLATNPEMSLGKVPFLALMMDPVMAQRKTQSIIQTLDQITELKARTIPINVGFCR